jgi:NDP-sugar pyrophosphorylase family protein
MALVQKADTSDFGSVTVDASFRITSFREKVIQGNRGLVNAGIYIMEREIFSFFPGQARFSLENDLFPTLSGERCAGFIIDSELIDIGTPERYQMALQKIRGGT